MDSFSFTSVMIGVIGFFMVVGLVDVLGVIIREPPPPPVHMLFQKISSEPFNKNFRVLNFKIFVPKKVNKAAPTHSFRKSKVVNYKKKWNSTGMPKSFKEIFDFYRQEGNYYPNEKKITTVPPVTENSLSSAALFPVSYHNEVHHDNKYDSFSDGSVVKPVAEVVNEGYLDKDETKIFFNNSTHEGDDENNTNDEDLKKTETYRYYQ